MIVKSDKILSKVPFMDKIDASVLGNGILQHALRNEPPYEKGMEPKEIVLLTTTFLPAPGIDVMREKGFLTWTEEPEPGVFRSYFTKDEEKSSPSG